MPQASARQPVPSPASHVEAEILALARSEPELGQAAVAERLRLAGHRISASGVRYIWQKHGLETTVKRLHAIAQTSREGIAALTEGQRQLLERGKVAARLGGDGTGAGRSGEEEPPERRRMILDAAAELFSEAGYDRTSIRDIARKVGLLPGSVYHHFASKDELYLSVHRDGFTHVQEKLKAAAAAGRDPWERLRLACEVHVAALVEGSPVDRITGHNLALAGNRELLQKVLPYREAYEDVFRQLVNDLPLAPGTDRSLFRLFLLGGMNWVHLWYHEGGRSPKEIADAMVEMLRNGVASNTEATGRKHG